MSDLQPVGYQLWLGDLKAQIQLVQQRQGQATTNFAQTLPAPQSELAQQTLKDPYIFDFLSRGMVAHERVILSRNISGS